MDLETNAEEEWLSLTEDGRNRVAIEGVRPEIDCGRFAIKRVVGDVVEVEADVFADGHDGIRRRLLYRHESEPEWREAPMEALGNDRWRGVFPVSVLGRYRYTVEGWVDRFRTWRGDLRKRIAAGQDVRVEALAGAQLVEEAAGRAEGADRDRLMEWAASLRAEMPAEQRNALALDDELAEVVSRYPDRSLATRYGKELAVVVDRERARFSAWYEVFPRSCAGEAGSHGTLRDCEGWLAYIAYMGFDVLYLPPIHPIGRTFRKGRNNAVTAEAGDPGSPWAIGSEEGGHKSVHPELGTLEDFRHLVEAARSYGIEVALDIALQCTPDHPYVREHPEWFRKRPDGTIQYAENPPKKYQDIYPLDFESENWEELWKELRSIFLFWIEQGVRIFRVDNPHTKAFPFWEWAIAGIKEQYPDVLFLSEAFTRPKVMARLAKLGFSQSYTYFTWRNTKEELTRYFEQLRETELQEYLRPNLWPNTPDILPEFLQTGGRPAFLIRLALAATLGASYGIYGPAYELCENAPREAGSEEYLHAEKYEIKQRDLNSEWSLKEFIARVNRIRKENAALQSDEGLHFHATDNPLLVCYSKAKVGADAVVVVVNLDPFHTQRGWVTLELERLGLDEGVAFQAHDLLSGARYLWQGRRSYVEMPPESTPVHILRFRKRVRTEKDFDYYL
ncbi:MAG: alpha-1,4-glucan--maltose-1-phosphate maltosyltransferase [Bryobacterales bacterium]|nr:alpha-1,4-glucan--maltose-1-phosphate maltosyltransferase [Bryobacterales bacterium]